MACRYYNSKTGKYFDSDQDMIKQFYMSEFELKNSAIYSADQIQSSIEDKIKKIPGINDYSKDSRIDVLDLVTKEHEALFNQVPGESGRKRLAPEYIKEERIYNYIKREMINNRTDHFDPSSFNYSEDLLPKMVERFGENTSIDTIKHFLTEIEDIIYMENLTKEFGTKMHEFVALKLRNDASYNTKINAFVFDNKNEEIFGKELKQRWVTRINIIVDNIIDKVQDGNRVISEIFVRSDENSIAQVKGRIDLVAVDTQGRAHIFEIKISKNKFTNWDSAKLRTLDWQLALYRQLLGQHINIDSTQLYVIPIQLRELGNPEMLFFDGIKSRSAGNISELGIGGTMTNLANKLIPRKVFVDYDEDRENKFKNDLSLLIEDYQIRTNVKDYDFDSIIAKAEDTYRRTGEWKSIYNEYEDIEELEKGIITATNKKELETKIKTYISRSLVEINKDVAKLRNALIGSIQNDQPIKTTSSKSESSIDLITNKLFYEYKHKEWEVIDNIPEAVPLGMIVLRNKRTGILNLVSVSVNNFFASSNIEGMSYGDLEYLKTFLFLNNLKKDLLPSNNDKLGEIIVFNPKTGTSHPANILKKFRDFSDRMYKVGLGSSLNLTESNILPIENMAIYTLDRTLRTYNESDKELVTQVTSLFQNSDLDKIDLDQLKALQKEFLDTFEQYKGKTMDTNLNFDDPKEMIFAFIQSAIIAKSQSDVSADYQRLSKYSANFSDFKSLIAAFYTKNQQQYDKEQRRIQGLVQGLAFTTPDMVKSKDLRNINKIMSEGNQKIGEKMLKQSGKIQVLTDEFYKEVDFGRVGQHWWGDTQKVHKNMWLHKGDKVDDRLRTKNPFILDTENAMLPAERKYLKAMLFEIGKYRLNVSDTESSKLDYTTIEGLSKNEKFKIALETGDYFEMPLVRREELSRYAGHGNTNAGDIWRDRILPYLHEINDYIDPRELTEKDLKMIELQKIGFYEMYDVYGRQNAEMKARAVERNGVNYFEWNLDTIAHRIAFNKIRKNIFDNRLPIINAYVWWMKLSAGKQNEDLSKQLDYITKQLSLSIYDEPIIDGEFKDIATVAAMGKSIVTAAMLSFRPALFLKEMSIGVFKGIALASSKMYGQDQFGVNDLMAAYGKLIAIDNKVSTEFNMIDKLNHFYRIANMDINTVAKKLQTDRRGLAKGLGRWMYAMNTIPDYYNRLSLFMAKMIKDGSYDAHTVVNKQLIYDPTKDLRFSHYLANRESFKTSKGEYMSAPNDLKFNTQRQHYLVLQNQLNKEGALDGEKAQSEKDLIYKAYSEIERNSIKSFSDMAYGYYDKDSQSQIGNMFIGMLWLQFMQFWPGKMKMWFGKPQTEDEAVMGSFQQKFIIEDGIKKLMWRKAIMNEEGDIIKFDHVTENTGDPLMEWKGSPHQGLLYSFLYTLQDILTLNFDNIKNNPQQLAGAKFAIADGLLMFLMFALFKAFFDGWIADNGTDGINGNTMKFFSNVNTKILREADVWQNTMGSIQIEPILFSYSQRIANNMMQTISSDRTIMDVAIWNVGAAEMLRK